MNRVSAKRRKENHLRDIMFPMGPEYRCEFRECTYMANDRHEVQTAARGGSRVDPENVLRLCRPHHDLITDNTGWSDRHGWTTASWCTPAIRQKALELRLSLDCPLSCGIDHRIESGASDD